MSTPANILRRGVSTPRPSLIGSERHPHVIITTPVVAVRVTRWLGER